MQRFKNRNMKTISKITIAVLLVCGVSFNSQAQKFGHINFEELIAAMPEKAEAQKTLEKEYNEMKGIIESMSVEFNKKYLAAQQSQDTLSKASLSLLEQELQDMQTRIMQYQQNAEAQLNQRQTELLEPIMTKAENAIKTVANREGFLYIFDTSTGSSIIASDKATDITPLVKKELGL